MALTPAYFMEPPLWMRWQLLESILKTWREEEDDKKVPAHEYLRKPIPQEVVKAGKFRENYLNQVSRWQRQIKVELTKRKKLNTPEDYVTLDSIFSILTGNQDEHADVHQKVFVAATHSMARYMIGNPRDSNGEKLKPMNQRHHGGLGPDRDL